MQYSTLHVALANVLPLDDPELAADLERNVDDMLTTARRLYRGVPTPEQAGPDPAHLASGELHAARMQHPADALRAAELIFDAALPGFIDEVGATETSAVIRATRSLHTAIWGRFPAGAVAYTEALRQHASAAHLDARLQVARELHDRVSHSILAGIQRVQMRDASMVADGVDLLRNALRDIQTIAVALHARVGDRYLDDAFTRTAANLLPIERLRVESTGVPVRLPSWASEEALTILIEALMNARKHAPESHVEAHFVWTHDRLTATVSDDGVGFDPRTRDTGGLGLRTMRERAHLIGARLEVMSEPGSGTAVILNLLIRT